MIIREAGSGRVEGLGEIRHQPGRTKAAAVCDGTVRQLQNGLTATSNTTTRRNRPTVSTIHAGLRTLPALIGAGRIRPDAPYFSHSVVQVLRPAIVFNCLETTSAIQSRPFTPSPQP